MLPIPVEIERASLSPELTQAVHRLNGARPTYFTVTLVLTWVTALAAIAGAEYVHTWWATALAIYVVATRINLLALLVHDQAHLLGYKNRFGDLLVNLFCAYPLLVLTVEGYARIHLAHHRHYFTEQDPDHQRKSGPEWDFPKSPWSLARLALADLLGLHVIKLIRSKDGKDPGLSHFTRRGVHPPWLRPVYFAVLAGVLTWTHTWLLFLLYWVLPIVTVMQVIVRWGAACEHQYNVPGAKITESTPLIELRWWDRVLLPNLNFTLHLYHHYFPGVAFSELPKVHQMFKQAGLVNQAAVFHGYGDYLRYLVGKRPVSSA